MSDQIVEWSQRFAGASGQRILRAIAAGETDPARLRQLGDKRLRATGEELRDALNRQLQPLHRKVLMLYLQRLDLIEAQIAELESMIAEAMKAMKTPSSGFQSYPA